MILVGTSMGGGTAIDFALTYPDFVKKLVLVDSAGLTGSSPLGKFMFPPLDNLAAQLLRNPKVPQNISRNAYHNKSWASEDALLYSRLHWEIPGWSQALIAFTKSRGYKAFKPQQLGKIREPTLRS